MAPTVGKRELLFQAFARTLLTVDMDVLYQAVTPDFLWSYHDGEAVTKLLTGADATAAHLAGQKTLFSAQSFHDVVYHHLPETTFMSFRVSEIVRATGAGREQRGIELYSFGDGRIATKDVYRKPIVARFGSVPRAAGGRAVRPPPAVKVNKGFKLPLAV